MYLSLRSIFLILALATITLPMTRHAAAADYYLDTLPQSDVDTCQSYSIMLALAHLEHPAFKMESAEELRVAEKEFRARASAIAASQGRSSLDHKVWAQALEAFTLGHFVLKQEYAASIDAWAKRVAQITGVSSIARSVVATATLAKNVVMTSVIRIGANTYRGGHIIATVGIDGTSKRLPPKIIAINSAIKGPNDSKKLCSADDMPGDYHYRTGIQQTGDYELKAFPGYLLMWLTPS